MRFITSTYISNDFTWSMRTPNFFDPVAVFPEYVTPDTEALVASDFVLILRAWSLLRNRSVKLPLVIGIRVEHNSLVDDSVSSDHDIGDRRTTGDGTL